MGAGEWDQRYRPLKEGEIVQAGDEVLAGGWHNDDEVWEPVRYSIGRAVPNPLYPAHCRYRRLRATGGEEGWADVG